MKSCVRPLLGWMVGEAFVRAVPLGKSIFVALPRGAGHSRTRPGMLLIALTGDPRFSFCLPRLLLCLHRLGTEEARCPLPPLLFVSSFDFLLKTIVSRGVRRIVAFPFIPPLDVTLRRGHFLVSDALTPDTSRQMWSVVSEARLTAPPPLPLPYPNLMRRG